eukprot:13425022-Alexandrium_andersonii.AAC.1
MQLHGRLSTHLAAHALRSFSEPLLQCPRRFVLLALGTAEEQQACSAELAEIDSALPVLAAET